MRLLICSINFYPELTSTGKYTGETAFWLAEQGVDVRVVTAPPYYPAWRLDNNYSRFRYVKEQINDKLRVYRCPLWVPADPSGFKRLLHLLSFAISTMPILLIQIFWRPNVVLVVEPPLLSAPVSLLLSKLCRSKSWLHIQDYEVDAAFNLGLLKGAVLKRGVLWAERFLLKTFDRVSSITPAMMRRAVLKGVDPGRIIFFPNWANLEQVTPVLRQDSKVQELLVSLKLPADAFIGLYAGNIGNKQGIEIVADVARRLSEHRNIFFVFCGSGSGLADLIQRCVGLTNVRFLDVQPADKFAALLGMANVHFLPQKTDVADLVMPSKLTGMMASGRPIIATADPGTAVAEAVEGCGIVVPASDVAAFCKAVLVLKGDQGLCENLGKTARAWAEANLDQNKILASFLQNLKGAIGVRDRHAE